MFWDIFYALCESRSIKPLHAVKEMGIAAGNITAWKNGRTPSGTSLQKIANYFGVTTAYLLGEEDSRSAAHAPKGFVSTLSLTEDEQRIILTYRSNVTFRDAVNNIYSLTTQETGHSASVRVYRAARSTAHHDAEIIEMDVQRLDKLKKAPMTDDPL